MKQGIFAAFWLASAGRLWIAVAVAIATLPSQAAASPTEARRLNTAADAEFETGLSYAGGDGPRAAAMIRHAAFLYWEAAQELPETDAHRGARADLLGKALSAYRQAQQLRPDRQNLDDSLRIIRAYSEALRAAYGDRAASLAEYERAQSHESALTQELAANAPVPATTAPNDERAERPSNAQAGAKDAPQVAPPAQTIDSTRPRGTRTLTIGLGISAGLAGAAGLASLGTGLALVSEPFRGAKYRDIAEAAADLDVPGGTDYCAFGRAQGAEDVVSACDAYQATRRASLATGITAGAAAISAVVFGVLLARARRVEAPPRGPQVGLVPSLFGAELRVAVAF